jgi:hypothetical protein
MTEIQFTCPQCNATLRTKNLLLAGQQGQCPKCGAVFAIPGGPSPQGTVKADPARPFRPAACAEPVALGQRVFARWYDGFWYPATVRYVDPREVMLKYDDGTPASLTPAEVRPLALNEGDRVQARWQGGPAYYLGTVRAVNGETVVINYDDGAEETTTVSLLRVIRREDIPWRVGDRVVATWAPPEPFFYPAVVRDIGEDGVLSVDYDDGDSAHVAPGQVFALDLREGDLVFARWQRGPLYYPARILERHGNTLRVRYEEDGVEEQTAIRYVRVLRPPPAAS